LGRPDAALPSRELIARAVGLLPRRRGPPTLARGAGAAARSRTAGARGRAPKTLVGRLWKTSRASRNRRRRGMGAEQASRDRRGCEFLRVGESIGDRGSRDGTVGEGCGGRGRGLRRQIRGLRAQMRGGAECGRAVGPWEEAEPWCTDCERLRYYLIE
jgi:hypothetical protein